MYKRLGIYITRVSFAWSVVATGAWTTRIIISSSSRITTIWTAERIFLPLKQSV